MRTPLGHHSRGQTAALAPPYLSGPRPSSPTERAFGAHGWVKPCAWRHGSRLTRARVARHGLARRRGCTRASPMTAAAFAAEAPPSLGAFHAESVVIPTPIRGDLLARRDEDASLSSHPCTHLASWPHEHREDRAPFPWDSRASLLRSCAHPVGSLHESRERDAPAFEARAAMSSHVTKRPRDSRAIPREWYALPMRWMHESIGFVHPSRQMAVPLPRDSCSSDGRRHREPTWEARERAGSREIRIGLSEKPSP